MIRIREVHIEEVRGIRKLTLTPDGKNLCIYGPNGSGKSGVVDAIEFALTGNMSRLSGKGTGGISVKTHGPHVDKRDYPDASLVRLKLGIPHLRKEVTVTRTLRKPRDPQIEPAHSDVHAVLDAMSKRPEITLSRREVIKFILTDSASRSRDVQTLLKLDEIDQVRSTLKTASNKVNNLRNSAETAVESAEDDLRRHLDLESLSPEEILTAVNEGRRILGLGALVELADDASFLQGAPETDPSSDKDALNKKSALRDLEAFAKEMSDGIDARTKEHAATALTILKKIERNPELLNAMKRREFLESGLTFVDAPGCPLCDTAWDIEDLRAHVRAKLEESKAAEVDQTALLAAGEEIANDAKRLGGLVDGLRKIADSLGAKGIEGNLDNWATDLGTLASKVRTVDGLRDTHPRLKDGWPRPPDDLQATITTLTDQVRALPGEPATAEALTFLAVAEDRRTKLLRARRDLARKKAASESATTTYTAYCKAAETVLSGLYATVQDEFQRFYRAINRDDEGEFTAKLLPSAGKLDLTVDFYKRGMFPPGAYHSEGHQDGMGVCLYLALMKQLLGENFKLAVLDDVVMSIDSQHRRQFCRLLKDEFPDTQFVITTHEQVWAQQLRSSGLVKSKAAVAFRGWTIDVGPLVHEVEDVWEEIRADMEREKISSAAGTLRKHLEFVLRDVADCLGAHVPYRSDDSLDLGDLLPGVIKRYKRLLDKASKSAKAWDDEAAKTMVKQRQDAFAAQMEKCNGEQWVINRAIHYNEWATFSREDFEPVVEAFKGLLEQVWCSSCSSWLQVSPRKGTADGFRCSCSKVNLNLKEK